MRNVYFVIENKENPTTTTVRMDFDNDALYEAFDNNWDSMLTDEEKTEGKNLIVVRSDSYEEVMTLAIDGQRSIFDLSNNTELSNNEIISLKDKIYDMDKYDIKFNNYYALKYGTKDGKEYSMEILEEGPTNDDKLEILILEKYFEFLKL